MAPRASIENGSENGLFRILKEIIHENTLLNPLVIAPPLSKDGSIGDGGDYIQIMLYIEIQFIE